MQQKGKRWVLLGTVWRW